MSNRNIYEDGLNLIYPQTFINNVNQSAQTRVLFLYERRNEKMKYAIVKVVNGNYSIHAEGFTDVSKAKVSFHGLCQTLWNAEDVITAEIMIVDENLDCVENYKEFIAHPVEEPETEEPIE